MFFNIVIVFAIHQHELAIGIHVPPPWGTPPQPLWPPQPSRSSQSTSLGCPAPYITLPLVISFAYGNLYVSGLFSQATPPSPSATESRNLSLCLSPLRPCTYHHWFHLSRFHIYVLIHDIYLSLFDLLHSV